MLSDTESDAESIHRLTINEHYAKAFAYRKEREELEKRVSSHSSRSCPCRDFPRSLQSRKSMVQM